MAFHKKKGKFFKPNAKLNLPIYLDSEMQSYLRERAQLKETDLNKLANKLLRRDINITSSVM